MKATAFFAGRSFTFADRQPGRPDAIDEAFAKARETIGELIDAASCWSVAQAADYRRAK